MRALLKAHEPFKVILFSEWATFSIKLDLLLMLYQFICVTPTTGHWRSTVNRFSSKGNFLGSLTLTVHIWFSTSQYSIELRFESNLIPTFASATNIKLSELRQNLARFCSFDKQSFLILSRLVVAEGMRYKQRQSLSFYVQCIASVILFNRISAIRH